VQWIQCILCSQHNVRYVPQPVPTVPQPIQSSLVTGSHYPAVQSPGARNPAGSEWDKFFPSFWRSYPGEAYTLLQQTWLQISSTKTPSLVEPAPRRDNDNNYSRSRGRRSRENSRDSDNDTDLQNQLQGYRQESEERIKHLKDVAQKLKAENETFRAQIFSIGSGRGPLQEESFYIRRFDSLNTTIDQGVLKLVRQTKHALGEPLPVDEILESISGLGDHGKNSSRFLGESTYSLQALYSQGPSRIALIGHVVAMLLVHRVFEPYGIGMSDEFSRGLRSLEFDLAKNGN